MMHLLSAHKLTSVGTICKNKPEKPPTFLSTRNREDGNTIFGFQKDIALVSIVL